MLFTIDNRSTAEPAKPVSNLTDLLEIIDVMKNNKINSFQTALQNIKSMDKKLNVRFGKLYTTKIPEYQICEGKLMTDVQSSVDLMIREAIRQNSLATPDFGIIKGLIRSAITELMLIWGRFPPEHGLELYATLNQQSIIASFSTICYTMTLNKHQGNIDIFVKKVKKQLAGEYQHLLKGLIDKETELLHARSLETGVCKDYNSQNTDEVLSVLKKYHHHETIMNVYGIEFLLTMRAVGSFLLKIISFKIFLTMLFKSERNIIFLDCCRRTWNVCLSSNCGSHIGI